MIELRQSTASQEIPLGYFLDSTDGNTAEPSLTIANTDILIWKTGATSLAAKNTGGATHMTNGMYYCTLDAVDSNTLGPLVIYCHVTGALAVKQECAVLPINVYDSKYSTDKLEVEVVSASAALPASLTSATYTTVTSFHASVAGYSTFDPAATGVTLAASAVPASLTTIVYNTLTSFHASVAGYSTFDPAASGVTLGGATYTTVTSFHASVTGYSTFDPATTGVTLTSATYTSADSFKASVAGYSTFNPATTGVTLTSATYTSADSFKASVTGYSTFDPAASGVSLTSATYTTVTSFMADTSSVTVATIGSGAIDTIHDEVMEGTTTFRQAQRLMLAVLTGKTSGGSTTTLTFRDIGDTKNRLVVTVDASGNRTAVGTRDGS